MNDEVVSSTQNSHVVAAAKLHRRKARRETGLSLLEGPNLLEAALEAGVSIARVFALQDDDSAGVADASEAGLVVTRVTRGVLDRVAPTEHPRGPVAVFRVPEHRPRLSRDRIVLWGIGDPGNAGTLIRTAAAFGHDVMAAPGTVGLWGPKVLRAAAGAHFMTSVVASDVVTVESLRAEGFAAVATVVSGGVRPAEMPGTGPVALLVGEEAAGLRDEVIEAADILVTIPMPGGTESLNSAVAAGIVAYELSRRR